MIYLHALETIAILMISSLGPGLLFIRYLRWRPLETLCGSVALSFLLFYLAALAIYGLELSPAWAYAPTVLAFLATLVCVGDLRRLSRHRETRAAMLAFLALFSWLLLLLLMVRNYSGAGWWGDWVEHYERTLFFSEHQPLDTLFLSHYVLPARPPMMNLLAAQLFWQVSTSFEMFQIVFAYLNALVILPCALLAPSLVAKTRNRAWLIAGFVALSPMFAQNGTYTWTKEFAAFYELVALGLYLSAWRHNDSSRLIACCAFLSTGMLVHYSTAPFVLFLAGHYLIVLFCRRNHRWRELIASAAVSIAIFSTYLGWSLYAYGAKVTFGSNTAVTASQEFSLSGNILKIVENTFNTLVPFPLRGSFKSGGAISRQLPAQGLAYLRDWLFCIYQTSFPAMIGLGGLTLVVWQLAKIYFHPLRDPWQHRYSFWIWFVGVVTFISIAVNGEYDYFGNAHICLQPMALLGLTFAAVALPHAPRLLRGIALVGLLIDASLGVLLQFHLLKNDFGIAPVGDDRVTIRFHLEMGKSAVNNAVTKFNHNVTFLGDHVADFASFIELIGFFIVLGICIGLWLLATRSVPADLRSHAAVKTSNSAGKKSPPRR